MNVTDLWMRLEALAHLRGLPRYAAIKAQVEGELNDYNESLKPKAAAPKAVPAVAESESAPAEIERRV